MNADNVLQPVAPVTPVTPRKGWWGRNWKWFVPTGCLTMLALVAGVIFLLLSLIFGVVKSSDAYKQAMLKVRADSAVTAALGTPIKEGFFTAGSIKRTIDTEDADLSIPISGPKGNGTVYVEAEYSFRQWTFSRLEVEIKATGEKIDLVAGGSR